MPDNPALQQGIDAYRGGDFATALAIFVSLAGDNEPAAHYGLGLMHVAGHGVAADATRAARFFEAAALQNFAPAQLRLGLACKTGNGVAKSPEAAQRWLERAALAGMPDAQYELAVLFYAGVDIALDLAQAARWMSAAAEQDHPTAQFCLGYMYRKGEGVAQNDRQSVAWYRKASRAGVPAAQNNLGFMYEHGHGTTQSYDMAETCYRRAAAIGDREATASLQALDALRGLADEINALGDGDFSTLDAITSAGSGSGLNTVAGSANDHLWSQFCQLGWAGRHELPPMPQAPGVRLLQFKLTETGHTNLFRFLPFVTRRPVRRYSLDVPATDA